ncbi:MAG: ferredoxin III, nif-specific [Gammaproteobacteria bacterium]|nr:ferredoxin III, nif-specific [Gammaproteobacteria bacterium]MDJ0889717.1 ferredoxin III, nif-specific [Gammaproteobacteria bacterium]
MSTITGLTRGGVEWTPAFVTDLNQTNCIGCGRCFKVCPRDVFELVDREDLNLEGDEDWDDDDDDFSDDTSMVMSLKDMLDCIGCQACSRVCPKKCLSHEPAPAAA